MRTPADSCEPRLALRRFENGDIDAGTFSHELHVYTAWKMLSEVSPDEAFRRYAAALRRITAKFGVPEKYHETITGFFLFLIAERRAQADSDDWRTFKTANPDLLSDAGGLLDSHYTPARLADPLARRQFLLPDKAADHGAAS